MTIFHSHMEISYIHERPNPPLTLPTKGVHCAYANLAFLFMRPLKLSFSFSRSNCPFSSSLTGINDMRMATSVLCLILLPFVCFSSFFSYSFSSTVRPSPSVPSGSAPPSSSGTSNRSRSAVVNSAYSDCERSR